MTLTAYVKTIESWFPKQQFYHNNNNKYTKYLYTKYFYKIINKNSYLKFKIKKYERQ